MHIMKKEIAVFKALAEETRLRILILLEIRELCVCEIEKILRLSQSRVSRHLAILRNAGLVMDRREGTWIYYKPAAARSDLERVLQKCLRECFNDVPVVKKDAERLKRVCAKGRNRICPRRVSAKGNPWRKRSKWRSEW